VVLLGLSLAIVAGCGDTNRDGSGCRSSDDCELGEVCLLGKCDSGGGNNGPNNGGNNGPNNGGNNGNSACPNAPQPMPGDLVLNEILAAVPTDATLGDVNKDGTRDAADDEFIELVNLSGGELRIGGTKLYKEDDATATVTLATECLAAGEALVVFGGLADGASLPVIPGAKVEIANKQMSLKNSGVRIRLESGSGTTLYDLTFPTASNESVTLSPQLQGENFVTHTSLASAPYSPGTCPDGSALSTGCPGGGNNGTNNTNNQPGACDDAPGPTASATGERIMVNEILSNVPNDPITGDVNRDGKRDASEDEFIEIVNISGETVRIKGLQIYKEGAIKTEVKLECLPAGGTLVIFGGGTAPNLLPAFTEVADKTFGLTNGGTQISLQLSATEMIQVINVPNSGPESLVRWMELSENADFVKHTQLAPGVLYSPGTCANGGPISAGCAPGPGDDITPDGGDGGGDMDVTTDVATDVSMDVAADVPPTCDGAAPGPADLVINEILSAVPTGIVGDSNGDGVRDAGDDEFIELWNASGQSLLIEGITVRKVDTTKATLHGCLAANTGIVIFGGIEANATLPSYSGMTVQVATSNFTFADGGSTVRLYRPDATVLSEVTFGAMSGSSFVRQPELNAASAFVRHATVTNSVGPFSPGTCANGAALSTGCP